jgi:hypothetical protein
MGKGKSQIWVIRRDSQPSSKPRFRLLVTAAAQQKGARTQAAFGYFTVRCGRRCPPLPFGGIGCCRPKHGQERAVRPGVSNLTEIFRGRLKVDSTLLHQGCNPLVRHAACQQTKQLRTAEGSIGGPGRSDMNKQEQ